MVDISIADLPKGPVAVFVYVCVGLALLTPLLKSLRSVLLIVCGRVSAKNKIALGYPASAASAAEPAKAAEPDAPVQDEGAPQE